MIATILAACESLNWPEAIFYSVLSVAGAFAFWALVR